jgi:hypothetical protein
MTKKACSDSHRLSYQPFIHYLRLWGLVHSSRALYVMAILLIRKVLAINYLLYVLNRDEALVDPYAGKTWPKPEFAAS